MNIRKLLGLVLLLMTTLPGKTQLLPPQEKDYAGYLFVYFKSNRVEDEAICYAVSCDGYNYRALNNNQPVIDSKTISSTGGVRDPHILRAEDGNTFYMVCTDMTSSKGWNSNRAMVLMKSTDLVNWASSVVNIQEKYPNQENLKRVWAPQTIYDASVDKYLIYWSMKHGDGPDIIYYAYANKDFTGLESEPKQFFFPKNGKACIDGDIVAKNGLYHLFYKTEGHGNGIKQAITDSLASGRWIEQPGYKQDTREAIEGSFVFKLTGSDKYIMMYDVYVKHQYQFCESVDLDIFKAIDTEISMDFHPRHGSIIPVTASEMRRITDRWGKPENMAVKASTSVQLPINAQDNNSRQYWTDLAYQIAAPVLSNMSKGELSKNMQLELSPTWDGRDKRVSYMEAFGRLMDGIAPWLSLPDDNSAEGKQRKQLREWALKSYANAVNPNSPDYLLWHKEGQPLVDAAFIASSFLRAPKQLWEPLDTLTKQRYIEEFQQLRRIDPPYSNWLLFSATVETFLLSIDARCDMYRIHSAIRKIEEWYVGDGWYSDGEHFAFDYYNSYVIQPMYVQVLDELAKRRKVVRPETLETARKRMQRFGIILERFISPEGSFPVFGRSMTYRLGVFQPLALLAWKGNLPEELPEGQVRAALTAAIQRMFSVKGNFNETGFLQLGFAGHQPNLADWYTNNGSLYLTSEIFLPLGLPANHSFWTLPAQDWTAKKAWSDADFPKDHAIRE